MQSGIAYHFTAINKAPIGGKSYGGRERGSINFPSPKHHLREGGAKEKSIPQNFFKVILTFLARVHPR